MSFQLAISDHRNAAARLVGDAREVLIWAFENNPHITQTEVAEKIGVNRSVISRQLRGTADISISRVAEIADILGYEVQIVLNRHQGDASTNQSSRTNQFEMHMSSTARTATTTTSSKSLVSI